MDEDDNDNPVQLSPEESMYENVAMQAEVLIWLFRLIQRNPDVWKDPELLALLGIFGDDMQRLCERKLLDTGIDSAGRQAMKDMLNTLRTASRSFGNVGASVRVLSQVLDTAEHAITDRYDRFLGRLG